jgi:hypothetical protein
MLGAAAGFQLLDGLIGDAGHFGELRLAELQRQAAFSYAVSSRFHRFFILVGSLQENWMWTQDIL